jgi:hypothetical protein
MKNRVLLSLAVTLIAGFMLNACGKGDGGGSGPVATAPVGTYGTCPNGLGNGATGYPYNGTNGYQGNPYGNPGYAQGGYPTTNYWGNTGMSYSYSYQYQYGYGTPGYGNSGYVNPGLGYNNPYGYPSQNGYYNGNGYNNPNGFNNPNLALANSGCNPTGAYGAGGLCNAQQVCTNMGQPGMVHYGIGCYPACGPCMASVNGQCLPGI